jgi:hypothetical protein
MAPTDVKFPLSPSGEIIPYNYSIDYSPMKGRDILGEFTKSCENRQIRTGFYYTVVSNNWLNVDRGFVSSFFCIVLIYLLDIQVQNRTLNIGQMNITQETYENIVLQQLREVWSRYGTLDEIWFDGGLVLLTNVYLFINISMFYVLLDIQRL